MQKGKIDFNKVGDLVYQFAEDLIKDLQANLDKAQGKFNSPINSSFSLRQSITFEPLRITQNGVQFDLKLNEYYKWVDEGRKPGDRPPVDDILQWINTKPLIIQSKVDLTKVNKKGLVVKRRASAIEKLTIEEEKRKVAYLIARKIERKGTTATNFYSSVVTEERFNKFAKDLSEAFKQDIIISIKD